MEPEGSLQHSQVPATCPYPEPARSSPHPHSYVLKIHLNIILPSTSGSPKWSLSPSGLPTKILYTPLIYEVCVCVYLGWTWWYWNKTINVCCERRNKFVHRQNVYRNIMTFHIGLPFLKERKMYRVCSVSAGLETEQTYFWTLKDPED